MCRNCARCSFVTNNKDINMKLKDNTILITGGTSGIGLELGRALLVLRNTVILLGRNREKLRLLRAEGFETLACDLGEPSEVEQATVALQNRFPELNVVFNNAGVQYNYLFTEAIVAPDRIARELQVNLSGQLQLTQLLIPQLMAQPKAYIVNTTSGLGAFPKSDALTYSASKAGLRNFTTGLRYALKASNIRVMELIPPVTDTGMTRGREEEKMPADRFVARILPQLRKERRILTVPKMRFFLWISFLFPGLAFRILDNP